MKRALIIAALSLAALSPLMASPSDAWAEQPEDSIAAAAGDAEVLTAPEAERAKFVAIAIGIGLGLAALGGSLGQGRAAAAVVEGLSRNPGAYDKVFTPFILGMGLIESLVIYSLVMGLIMISYLG